MANEHIVIGESNGRERTEINLSTYKGVQYVDIRKYYFHGESGEWRPTPKGVSVPIEHAPDLTRNIRKLVEPLL